MTKTVLNAGRPMTLLEYAQEWQKSAEVIASANHYPWMCDQLGRMKRIIEVGCGSGTSTEALVAEGRQVLVIEANQHCASISHDRLLSKGIPVELILIDQLNNLASWENVGVKLLVEDILSNRLEEMLPHKWFDAIVCWLIGSNPEHVATSLGMHHLNFKGPEMSNYRLKVQKRCFDYGTRVLKNDGVVHIVDRAGISSWFDKDQLRTELAATLSSVAGSSYALSKGDCILRKLSDELKKSSVPYIAQTQPNFNGVVVLASVKAQLAVHYS